MKRVLMVGIVAVLCASLPGHSLARQGGRVVETLPKPRPKPTQSSAPPIPEATRTLTLEIDGVERTYSVQDLVAVPTGQQAQGATAPTRRLPTAQEVLDIEARLRALEDPDAPINTAPIAPTRDSGDLPIRTRRY